MRLLIVEDDVLVGQAILKRFTKEHYTVEWVKNGAEALQALNDNDFSIVLLDIGLPELSGFEVLVRTREAGVTTPVIILTARDAISDRIKGLDCGADDYLAKPFDMDELLARCRALVRRSAGRAENELQCGCVILNPLTHGVMVDGEPVILPANEFNVLHLLMERRGRVVTKAQIEEDLYGWSDGAESNTIEVYISQLRKKIGSDFIKTLRGVGYMVP